MAKKPTGDIGPIRVSPTEGLEWHKIDFPAAKEDVEKYIAQRFVEEANKNRPERFRFTNLTQNPEQDLDFTVYVAGQSMYLELLEIAPLERGGYDTATTGHNSYDMAKWILKKIRNKGRRQVPESKRSLLLYTTHWSFHFSDTTVALLQYWLLEKHFGYMEINIYLPMDTEMGIIKPLVPISAKHFVDFDPENYRDKQVFNLDPAGFKLVTAPSKQDED